MKLKGQKAVVTGGSRGIGKAICIELAKEGADVLINFNTSKEGAEKTLEQVKRYSADSFVYQADVSNEHEDKDMINQAIKQFGKIDILVNNAGISIKSPFIDYKNEDWDKVIGINMNGYRFCAKYAAINMKKNNYGRIINISSVHDVMCYKNEAPYAMSKASIKMMTKILALELSDNGILVNSVSPGAIMTEMNTKILQDKNYITKLLNRIPVKRIGDPFEVAKVVTFLCSEESSYINGTTIYVDGGLLLNYNI